MSRSAYFPAGRVRVGELVLEQELAFQQSWNGKRRTRVVEVLVGVAVLVETVVRVGVTGVAVRMVVRVCGSGGSGWREAVDELDGVCGHDEGSVCEGSKTRARPARSTSL